jgi:hypothetical protein
MTCVLYFIAGTVCFWLTTELSNFASDKLCGIALSGQDLACSLVGNIPLYLGITGVVIFAFRLKKWAMFIAPLLPALHFSVLVLSRWGSNYFYEDFLRDLYYFISNYSVPFFLAACSAVYVLKRAIRGDS